MSFPAASLIENTLHGQFRRARYTAQGTYLVSYLSEGQGRGIRP